MIKCIAIDDEPIALKIIQDFATRVEEIELMKTFTNPIDAQRYLKNFPVDLLFLDIQMPDISGISFYKSLENSPMVIFTTAFSEYAVEGFNLSAVDYLLKPIEFPRFLQATRRSIDFHNYITSITLNECKCIYVRADYKLVKVNVDEIRYIEGLNDYVKIHTTDKKTILTLMSMKSVLDLLPEKDFMRVHRSFIVPLRKVVSVRNKRIQLIDTEIVIGRSYKDNFMKWFNLSR